MMKKCLVLHFYMAPDVGESAANAIHHPTSYRPDIDGLRALAVIAVITFHAFPSIIHGGYVGVDVFFVISGFLISSIVLNNISEKKFSILDFYSRRIKRIFPALMLVLATTMTVGWAMLLSDEFVMLGQHTVAATIFGSNFWLWHEAGYFDKASELKPLLHLWSLAIEEQFYVVWPLLLFIFCRFTQRAGLFIFLSAAISFLSCIAHMQDYVTMFYFPQNRAWELLIGAFLAYMQHSHRSETSSKSPLISNAQSILGTTLIFIAAITLDKTSIFPGWLALLPSLGASLIIAAGGNAWINRYLFSTRAMVFIGLISYPLYLWHWPLLAFARIVEGAEPSATVRGICVILSLALSFFTYRCLERPLRSGGKYVVAGLLFFSFSICTVGYLCANKTIKPRSTLYGLEKIVSAFDDWGYPRTNIKFLQYNELVYESQGEGRTTTIFLGDSNMEQYLPRINRILTEKPSAYNRVIFGTRGGCVPILNVRRVGVDASDECTRVIETSYKIALENPDVDTVVIAAEWFSHLGTTNPWTTVFFDDQGVLYPMTNPGAAGNLKAFAELEKMITTLQRAGKRVFLILNIPADPKLDPRQLIERSWVTFGFGLTKEREGVDRKMIEAKLEPVITPLKAIADRTGVTTFDPVSIICHEDKCPALAADGSPIYKDGDHFNATYVKENLSFLDQTVIKR